jgi:putative transposase
VTRYRWVAARKAEGFPITAACGVAGVSSTAFNDWRRREARGPSDAERVEAELLAAIREIHGEFDGTYGEPRVTPELRERGWVVNHKRVERLMRVHGLVGVHKPPKVRTTIPAADAAPVPDLISQRFEPGAPDAAWIGRHHHVSTGEGWLYLASVLDLGSRCWLGYSMADHLRTELVAEAAWSSLKRELVSRYHFPDRATARRTIFAWINRYNTHRRHSTLGYIAPIEWENQYRRHQAHLAA